MNANNDPIQLTLTILFYIYAVGFPAAFLIGLIIRPFTGTWTAVRIVKNIFVWSLKILFFPVLILAMIQKFKEGAENVTSDLALEGRLDRDELDTKAKAKYDRKLYGGLKNEDIDDDYEDDEDLDDVGD